MKGVYGKNGKETKFTATGLSKQGASQYMFEFKDRDSGETKQISVATYFVKKLGIQLEFPHLQCVEVRTGLNLKGFKPFCICLLLYFFSTSHVVCSNASTTARECNLSSGSWAYSLSCHNFIVSRCLKRSQSTALAILAPSGNFFFDQTFCTCACNAHAGC